MLSGGKVHRRMSTTETMIGDKSTIDTFTNPSIAASMVPAMIFTYVLNNETGESHFPFVSDYSQDMFGLPASDIVNDPECFMNRVHPDDVNLFTASVLESMTNLTTCDLKLHMITTTGKVIHIHGRSSPHNRTITNIDGSTAKFTIWHGVLIDITQKQQIEGEKLQNFKNEELGLNRNQSCIGMNERGIFTEWNETMTELAGMDHVMGKPFMSVVTDLYKQKVDATEKSTINPAPKNQENRTFSNKNFTFMSKSGDKVHVSATCEPRKDTSEQLLGVFFSPDTTALQKAEKDKKKCFTIFGL
uniref:PAS domain-containing protein n=1 Tax=Corethron hystrix TaxID=216773 RepID=A0A7S1B9Z0_9STRA|mmetsp:Transcript_1863/g.3816  ORF Transcript_1863/g.3816 Transcript_1863/m.3816 type:complete len:302 (+) Transcript_1863:216-1121(+)